MKWLIAMIVASMLIVPGIKDYDTTNRVLVENYCSAHYPGRAVIYTENPMPECHRSDVMVLVSIEKSVSSGDGSGWTDDGCYIAYNEEVSKGEEVVSYMIWNPENNVEDDVVAVVDCGKVRE